ncbi:MAG: alpha/beta fold hydrolase [Clostridia bacterium]|nr:alpha/beta fold hydrolase [Clostridia bacterium]
MSNKKTNTALRIAAGVGLGLSGAALAVGALYTEIMTSVVSRRRTPATDAVVAMATGYEPAPPDPVIAELTRALKETPMETVAIRSRDNYVLRAHWYPAEGALRTVILVHGWHSRWYVDFSASAPFLHENRCNLLFIDQRCHGESGGDLISYGITERYDVLSWLDWLEENHGGLPVYLCGISMGAATVLMTAGLPIAGRVCGIIADCGYSTPQEIVSLTLKKNIGGMAGPTLAAINLNSKLREGFTLKDYTPIEAMTANKEVPCLFVHGDADDFVPWRMSLENYYACQAPKDLLVINGAGHGLSFLVDGDRYKKKILEFFAAYDVMPAPAEKPRKCLFGKRKADA